MQEIINVKEKMKQTEILEVLAESVCMPTAERLNSRAEKYMNNNNTNVFGLKIDNTFCGIIVLDCSTDKQLTILDIAVSKSVQKQGIGSRLIEFAKETYTPKIISAETDDDAVGFYKKLGFEIENLGEKYSGIMRYECKYYGDLER